VFGNVFDLSLFIWFGVDTTRTRHLHHNARGTRVGGRLKPERGRPSKRERDTRSRSLFTRPVLDIYPQYSYQLQ